MISSSSSLMLFTRFLLRSSNSFSCHRSSATFLASSFSSSSTPFWSYKCTERIEITTSCSLQLMMHLFITYGLGQLTNSSSDSAGFNLTLCSCSRFYKGRFDGILIIFLFLSSCSHLVAFYQFCFFPDSSLELFFLGQKFL